MWATVYKHGSMTTITGYGPIQRDATEVELNPMEPLWTWWQCQLTVEGTMAQLIQAFYSGKAVAVSNGSFKDQAGVAAWMIKGDMVANQVVGNGLTLGKAEDQSAY